MQVTTVTARAPRCNIRDYKVYSLFPVSVCPPRKEGSSDVSPGRLTLPAHMGWFHYPESYIAHRMKFCVPLPESFHNK